MFEKLPLHDATLCTVSFDWLNKTCAFIFDMNGTNRSQLTFNKVSEVHIPRHEPWGASVSVNTLKCSEETQFEVEMQSGDALVISAASWTYLPIE